MDRYVLLFFSFLFFSAGFKCFKMYHTDRNRDYISLTGTVVDYVKKRNSKGITSYAPVYEYRYAGETYRKEHNFSSSEYSPMRRFQPGLKFGPGKEIPLLVDSRYPAIAYVDDWSKYMNLIGALAFTAGGILVLFMFFFGKPC